MKLMKIEIPNKGPIKVNEALVIKSSEEIQAISIDLDTKRAELRGDGETDNIPCLFLGANKYTICLRKGADPEGLTEITFPELKGWDLFCATLCKYTIQVCFVKKED